MTFFYCQSGGVWLGEQLYELFVISAAAMLLSGLVRMSWGGEGYKGLGEGEGGRGGDAKVGLRELCDLKRCIAVQCGSNLECPKKPKTLATGTAVRVWLEYTRDRVPCKRARRLCRTESRPKNAPPASEPSRPASASAGQVVSGFVCAESEWFRVPLW